MQYKNSLITSREFMCKILLNLHSKRNIQHHADIKSASIHAILSIFGSQTEVYDNKFFTRVSCICDPDFNPRVTPFGGLKKRNLCTDDRVTDALQSFARTYTSVSIYPCTTANDRGDRHVYRL